MNGKDQVILIGNFHPVSKLKLVIVYRVLLECWSKLFLWDDMNKLIFFFMLCSSLSEAKDLFVKSLKAPLLKEGKVGAAVITTLDRGTKLEEVKIADKFTQVKSGAEIGFINQLFLSQTPLPGQKDSLLNQDVDISSKARKRASGFTSAAAARGLKEDSDDIFQALGEEDGARLKEMEALFVESSIGETFLHTKNETTNGNQRGKK